MSSLNTNKIYTPKDTIALISKMQVGKFVWWKNVIQSLWQQRAIRYFFAAATATIVDIIVFWLVFNKVLHQKNHVFLSLFEFKAPTVSLICGFSCGLITNFLITKFLVFNESESETRKQFLRFITVNIFVLIANYFFMWFLKEHLHLYATVSRAVSAVTIGVFSFTAHKLFSFKM